MAAGNIDADPSPRRKTDRKRLDSAAIGPFSLTAIGIASVVGAGIFVTTGEAAAQYAGPAVVFSFILAGIAAGLTALCYAELAAMVPVAGSHLLLRLRGLRRRSSPGSSAGTCCSSTCSRPRPSRSAGPATSSASRQHRDPRSARPRQPAVRRRRRDHQPAGARDRVRDRRAAVPRHPRVGRARTTRWSP